MQRRRLKALSIIAAIGVISTPALSADLYCLSRTPCSTEMIQGLYTDTFIKNFPNNKWEILLISNQAYYPGSNGNPGASIAWAVASMSPKNSRKVSETRGYSESVIYMPDQSDLKSHELQRVRAAIAGLVAECDRSPRGCIGRK
jgi:hypothetical protein